MLWCPGGILTATGNIYHRWVVEMLKWSSVVISGVIRTGVNKMVDFQVGYGRHLRVGIDDIITAKVKRVDIGSE